MAEPHRIEVSALPSAPSARATARLAGAPDVEAPSRYGAVAHGARRVVLRALRHYDGRPSVSSSDTRSRPVAHPHDRGQLPGEIGPGPVPERGRHGVPDHLALIVEA